MSSFNQNQQQQPASAGYDNERQQKPPLGYPQIAREMSADAAPGNAPIRTQKRGDGFWKGCCAALCCCCLLDACF